MEALSHIDANVSLILYNLNAKMLEAFCSILGKLRGSNSFFRNSALLTEIDMSLIGFILKVFFLFL